MLFQIPFPPPPDMPIDPPGPVEQLFASILVTLLLFETVVLLLPEHWREKIGVAAIWCVVGCEGKGARLRIDED